ncbi:DNA-binding transcriptional response regulator [Mucilaginibacter ginkgonis]|uniref:Response regulator transcription factor n=1 Tax=Mucilaginibacter ginkgonis TaxID=2682091 RepID=A0A6I4HUN5_9SPHI|nr:response regulator [Mucilaginibacter ginkgonis]QQL50183.1 response regulator transcription factor [Mucilaginibacter ginkgonis]
MHVLIIETEEIAAILEFLLKEDGHTTTILNEITDIRQIAAVNPDVVFAHERNVTGFTGTDIIKQLKSYKLTKHIKTVLLSTRPDIRELFIEAQADAYLPKPFDIDQIPGLMQRLT